MSDEQTSKNSVPYDGGLRIYFQNINGMRSKLIDFSLAVLEEDYDVIAIVETWLYPDILTSEFFNENNYNVYRRDRCTFKHQRGGGIFIAVKSQFSSSLISLNYPDTIEQLCVCISPSPAFNYKLFIFVSYIPPSSPILTYNMHLENFFTPLVNNIGDENVIICGDFNLPNIDWRFDADDKILTPFNILSVIESRFIDSILDNNFIQINNIPNIHNKFLDLVFLSENFLYSVVHVDTPLASTDSHHKAICIFLNRFCFVPYSSPPISFTSFPSEYNMFKANFSALNSLFSGTNWRLLFTNLNLSDMYQKFSEHLYNGLDTFIPKKVRRNNSDPPWYTQSLKRLKNARNKAHTRFIQRGGVLFRRLFVQLRKEYQFLHRFLYRSYIWSIENELKNNSKRFWVYINKIRKSSGFPNQMFYKDSTSSDLQSSVDLFAEYFQSVYNSDQNFSCPSFTNLVQITDLGFIYISEHDVASAMQLLDNNSSLDSNNICNLLLKNCSSSLSRPLSLIFQTSLNAGLFLDSWKFSTISPIFKSGSKSDITNYRGIAKLLVIPKLFESIVKCKIYEKIKNSISPCQHGFVAGRSTTTNLVLFTSKLINLLEKGSQIDAVYTDFSKAFDKVIITLLINKLAALGFHSSLLRWLSSYLTNRFQLVKIGNFRSKLFKAFSGVPQGSHLGPLLFILMINDLPSLFNSDCILMYADDVKLFAEIKSIDDSSKLQSYLNNFVNWCSLNGFTLNFTKCSVITFHRCRNPCLFQYSLSNASLPRVDSIKDLGILLDPKLSFIPHLDFMCAKACRMLGFIKRNTRDFKDFLTLKSLFCSLVRSILEYGSIIWSPGYQVHINRLERVQRSFSRLALIRYGFDFQNLPTYPIRCKLLGLELLSNRRQIACISFIQDILTNRIDCPDLLSSLFIHIPTRNLRSNPFLLVPFHTTNYGCNEPITRSMLLYNKYFNLIDFHLPRDLIIKTIKMYFYREIS